MSTAIRTIGLAASEDDQLAFPDAGYIGVPARIAELYSQHHEAPQEFVYSPPLPRTNRRRN